MTGIAGSSGTLDASGRTAGETGGSVEILGKYVGLFEAARVDVSGDAGGGTVLLGGNAQGAGPQANALRSYVGPDAAIEADAISGGSGGQVVVWSDESTRFYGSISARGGARSGDGGFVEVSGREWLSFDGRIDAGAPRGLSGTILFDPRDITIQAAGANDASLTATGIAFNAPNQTADHTFSAAAIAALTGNITLQASRSLTVNQALNLANQTAGETVSLQSGNTITVNQSITTGGADLSITSAANSGWTGYSATGPITIAAGLNAGGGSIALSSGGATTFSGAPTITANNLTLTASTLTTLNNATLAVSGALTAKPSTTASSIGLAGGAGTFSLDAAEIARIKASGASSVTLGAAGGTGALAMGANVDLAGRAVTLHSGRINDATRILIADSLNLNLASTTGANTVRTNAGALSVNTSAGSSATNRSATITEADGVALGAMNLGTGTLSLTAGGAVTQTGALTAATLGLVNTAGNTTLDHAGNAVGILGTINTSGRTFTLVDNVATGITQTGVLTASTLSLVNTAGATTLSQANAVSSLGAVTSTGGNFTLNNKAGGGTAMAVTQAIDATGRSVDIDSGTAAMSFSGAPAIAANNLTLTASTLNTLENATLAVSGALTLKPACCGLRHRAGGRGGRLQPRHVRDRHGQGLRRLERHPRRGKRHGRIDPGRGRGPGRQNGHPPQRQDQRRHEHHHRRRPDDDPGLLNGGQLLPDKRRRPERKHQRRL